MNRLDHSSFNDKIKTLLPNEAAFNEQIRVIGSKKNKYLSLNKNGEIKAISAGKYLITKLKGLFFEHGLTKQLNTTTNKKLIKLQILETLEYGVNNGWIDNNNLGTVKSIALSVGITSSGQNNPGKLDALFQRTVTQANSDQPTANSSIEAYLIEHYNQNRKIVDIYAKTYSYCSVPILTSDSPAKTPSPKVPSRPISSPSISIDEPIASTDSPIICVGDKVEGMPSPSKPILPEPIDPPRTLPLPPKEAIDTEKEIDEAIQNIGDVLMEKAFALLKQPIVPPAPPSWGLGSLWQTATSYLYAAPPKTESLQTAERLSRLIEIGDEPDKDTIRELQELRGNNKKFLKEPLPNGDVLIAYATRLNKPKWVQCLIENGADPFERQAHQQSAWDIATLASGSAQIKKTIIVCFLKEHLQTHLNDLLARKQAEGKSLTEEERGDVLKSFKTLSDQLIAQLRMRPVVDPLSSDLNEKAGAMLTLLTVAMMYLGWTTETNNIAFITMYAGYIFNLRTISKYAAELFNGSATIGTLSPFASVLMMALGAKYPLLRNLNWMINTASCCKPAFNNLKAALSQLYTRPIASGIKIAVTVVQTSSVIFNIFGKAVAQPSEQIEQAADLTNAKTYRSLVDAGLDITDRTTVANALLLVYSPEHCKAAGRALMGTSHPDKGGPQDLFIAVQKVYEICTNVK